MTGKDLQRQTLNKILLSPQRRYAVMLVAQGMALTLVATRSKLSLGAVKYWSRVAGVKTTDYRNGRTRYSTEVIQRTKNFSVGYLQNNLKTMQPMKQIK